MAELLNNLFQIIASLFLGMSSVEYAPNQKIGTQENPQIAAFEVYDHKNSPVFVASLGPKGHVGSFCISKKASASRLKKLSFSLPQQ